MTYYFTDFDKLDKEIDAIFQMMPEDRKQRAEKFYFEKDKKLNVMAYAVLLYALRMEENRSEDKPSLLYGQQGKPELVDYPDLHFNISHCVGITVCSLAREKIGVDVERRITNSERLKERVLSKREKKIVNAASDVEMELAKFWTRKESYLKFLGIGLCNDMNKLDLTDEMIHLKKVVLSSYRIKDYYLSVCSTSTKDHEVNKVTYEDIKFVLHLI